MSNYYTTLPLTNSEIAKVMLDHDIPVEENEGKLFVENIWSQARGDKGEKFSEMVEVTGWNSEEVAEWLGY